MPLFYFHMVSKGSYAVDREGLTFANVDDAYLEACRAALDMSFEMLRKQLDPNDHRFEIIDEFGTIVMDVPFAEVLRPRRVVEAVPLRSIVDTVQAGLARNRELRTDLAYQIGAARRSVLQARELLSRSRACALDDAWVAPSP